MYRLEPDDWLSLLQGLKGVRLSAPCYQALLNADRQAAVLSKQLTKVQTGKVKVVYNEQCTSS